MNRLGQGNRIRKATAQGSILAMSLFLLLVTFHGVAGLSLQVIPSTSTDTGMRQFVGTWYASFKGKTFLTINLENQEGKLTGTVSHGDIQTDEDGELTSAEEQDGSDPIVEARLTHGILRITTKEEDSQDTIQYQMKLAAADQAEFRLLTPPGVTAPKPWKLERAKAGQQRR